MILSDTQILKEMDKGSITIDPFDPECLGSNSYDVHLGNTLAEYTDIPLDVKEKNRVVQFYIPPEGYVLEPGRLYLGSTMEYTETHDHVPFLEGKSSVGRLGIKIHDTAGKGDVGFCNFWTLEISCQLPVRIYGEMLIGQLIYHTVEGKVKNPYNKKKGAKYTQRSSIPMPSQMWRNFKDE